MRELIEKIEAAKEGSRELDAEITLKICPDLVEGRPDPELGVGHWIHPRFGKTYAEYYTTSLDDALTLVPEGWGWSISDAPNSDAQCCMEKVGATGTFFCVKAATPALAIVAACLRAIGGTDAE